MLLIPLECCLPRASLGIGWSLLEWEAKSGGSMGVRRSLSQSIPTIVHLGGG